MRNLSSSNTTLRVALLGLAMLAAPAARADIIFNVNTLADLVDDDTSDGLCHTSTNTCSLRAAIMQANHLTVPVTRIHVAAGTYVLTRPPNGADGEDSGDLNLATPINDDQVIVISGAGAANTIIDANQIDRAIAIDQHATATIAGVTIRNGRAQDLSNGGGIYNFNARLTVSDCIIESNYTDTSGGGIYSMGILNILRSTIRSNVARFGGGVAVSGPAAIRDSTFYSNGADYGGGIYVTGPLTVVVNSTISLNYANTHGGGILSYGDTVLYNTSVVGNDADHDRDEKGGIGGGVYVSPHTDFKAYNTLIAGNTLVDSPIYNDCYGTLAAFGWNLLGESESCVIAGDGAASVGFISLNTIGPLQDNGGPTWTHALLAGSEAIDTTHDDVGCYDDSLAPLATDQRGALRPAGPRCDVGAFEYGAISDRVFRNDFDG